MKNVFLKGAAGTLTVFSWHTEPDDGEVTSVIDEIFTTGKLT